ncbi:extracellular solute-binding protein [Novispirillum sp. DQ9]|uniref:extracellular solute-binding protein n=1 Tax=Novispirillum sp. DQ9 TaxID=3398612 RepID=UPI003C7EA09E
MVTRRLFAAALACLAALPLLAPAVAKAQERFITVASTTSTEQSGLFKHLLPRFTGETGIAVRVVAVGTGQALKLGENGDADVVLVHDTPSEEKFVAAGFGVDRRPVMYNDFVLVGPASDPAGVKGGKDVAKALAAIAGAKAPFASRGDDSGTDKAEKRLWQDIGVAPAGTGWYRETGSGMGPTLNTAAGMGAYALTDRGTWLNFKNRQDLEIVVEGDRRLANPYGVILVSPARHAHVKEADGRAFIDWLTGPKGQDAIASYTINGEQLFFPDAKAAN